MPNDAVTKVNLISPLKKRTRSLFEEENLKQKPAKNITEQNVTQKTLFHFLYPKSLKEPYLPQLEFEQDHLVSPRKANKRLSTYNELSPGKKIKRRKEEDNDYSNILIPTNLSKTEGYFLTYYRQFQPKYNSDPNLLLSSKVKLVDDEKIIPGGIFGIGGSAIVRLVEVRKVVKYEKKWAFTSDKPAWGTIKISNEKGQQAYKRINKETELSNFLGDYSDCAFQPFCWYDPSTDKAFMIEPFVPQENLYQYVKKVKKISPVHLYQATAQLCQQGINIWCKGYLHRDIKPENIQFYVNENGDAQLKLRDFGMSMTISEAANSISLGTPRYMPNILHSIGHHQDIASELYGIGATIKFLAGWIDNENNYRVFSTFFREDFLKYKFITIFPEKEDPNLLALFHFTNWLMKHTSHTLMVQQGDSDKLLLKLREILDILKSAVNQPLSSEMLLELESISKPEPEQADLATYITETAWKETDWSIEASYPSGWQEVFESEGVLIGAPTPTQVITASQAVTPS